jgi:coproporphyrinogen III oxidase
MQRVYSDHADAQAARHELATLQQRYVSGLEVFAEQSPRRCEWYRAAGQHGGGERFVFEESAQLSSASVNLSQVHYPADAESRLRAATALSAIVHPAHPKLPSFHLHSSLMISDEDRRSWRLIADLNPSHPSAEDQKLIDELFFKIAPTMASQAMEGGSTYFFIPALGRCRGVSHFFLSDYYTDSVEEDLAFATGFVREMICGYLGLLLNYKQNLPEVREDEKAQQLAYHTLYFFQVMTLDRGTTAGLLVHDDNDEGTLGSLPPRVDKNLLSSWMSRMQEPQDLLLKRIIDSMPSQGVVEVDEGFKKKLAEVIRSFYKAYPEAIALQARMPAAFQPE